MASRGIESRILVGGKRSMGILAKFRQLHGKTLSDWLVSIWTRPIKYEDFPKIHASQLQASWGSVTFAKENSGNPFLKWEHYFEIYDALFSNFLSLLDPKDSKKIKFLEIGVDRGGSLGFWEKILIGRADIYGIDINPKCAEIKNMNATIRIGSQDDPVFLKDVIAEMGSLNIVVDDGSHASRHIIKSFQTLFPLMETGGMYIIEDVHASYWNYWGLGGGLRRKKSAVEYFKIKIDELHQPYFRAKAGVRQFRETPIEGIKSIEFFDSIIVIRKGFAQKPPTLVESSAS
jgi:hypothetical protein